MIREVWEAIQPFALHPIQRAGLDEGMVKLLNFFSRPDLVAEWLKQYG